MTHLEGVIRLCEECGVNATNLTTVVGQTGQLKKMVNWYADAWVRIQSSRQTWKFMRRSTSWVLTAGQGGYTRVQCGITAGTFKKWIKHNGRTYFTLVGTRSEQFLDYQDYDVFRDLWLFGPNRTVVSRPYQFTIAPDDTLILGPLPISGLTATMEYYLDPIRLAADVDVPAVPEGHDDMIIVHLAKTYYGGFYGSKEAYATGNKEYTSMYRDLCNDQLPTLGLAGAFR
ncbi:MAG: hypothetical protein ABIU97_01805 [Dehalococcoidia bacterium]